MYDLEQENLKYWFLMTGELLTPQQAAERANRCFKTFKHEIEEIEEQTRLIREITDEIIRGV